MAASEANYAAVVRLLLEAGARPDATDRSGESALSLAEYGGHEDIVSLLEEAGG